MNFGTQPVLINDLSMLIILYWVYNAVNAFLTGQFVKFFLLIDPSNASKYL